jgi:chromate transport protein ChrA
VLPAPLITFSTFVGYLAGGLPGALLMTLGIFSPAFAFPIFLHRQPLAVAANRRMRPRLLGVTAGVIGLIAAVAVDVETSVVDVQTARFAVGAFYVLNRYHGELTELFVVLGCGAIGAAVQATIVLPWLRVQRSAACRRAVSGTATRDRCEAEPRVASNAASAVVSGTGAMRPIEPTRVATICSATASLLTASMNAVPARLKMRSTGRDAPT